MWPFDWIERRKKRARVEAIKARVRNGHGPDAGVDPTEMLTALMELAIAGEAQFQAGTMEQDSFGQWHKEPVAQSPDFDDSN